MTATVSTRGSSTPSDLPPTLGPAVCRWIEANCLFGPGDYYGRPARLRPDQKAFLWRAYELDSVTGGRKWRRIVRGRPKGDGKTQLLAWVAVAELAGPVRFAGWTTDGRPRGKRQESPFVTVGAASWDQADLLMTACRAAIEGTPEQPGPLAPYLECFDAEIQLKGGRPGRLKRVAAVAATNDGTLPTCVICDETHEWTAGKVRYHTVLRNGIAKRRDAWMCEITTAGEKGADSVAESAFRLDELIRTGQAEPDGVLVDWLAAADHWDLDDPEQLRAAIVEANPAVVAGQLPIENLLAAWSDPTLSTVDFRRYHLNQWVEIPEDSWLAEHPAAWGQCAGDNDIPDGADVWLGVDMALYHDSAAVVVVGHRDDGTHPVQAKIWTPGESAIDIVAVTEHIRQACRRWHVQAVGYDPHFFELAAQIMYDEGLPMVEMPQSPTRMVPACGHAFDLILDCQVRHDVGDVEFSRHVTSAARRPSDSGWTLSKGRSRHKIDAAVAMVMALWLAYQSEPQPADLEFVAL